jgi:hypothetical protein
LRVGDGTAALSNTTSAAVFLEHRSLTDGSLMGTAIPLPTSANGMNQPIALAGGDVSQGALTRSGDGRYLLFAGNAVAPGAQIMASAQVVIGRMAVNETVDTSTAFVPPSGASNTLRSVVSADGNSLWTSGSGGIYYASFGSNPNPTQLGSTDIRDLGIFSGQLYASIAGNIAGGINSVGTGLPTAPTVTEMQLPGFGNAGSTLSSYGFVAFDTDATPGIDKLYVADDRTTQNSGGVQRWSLNAGNWQLDGTMSTGQTSGARGLDGIQNGTSIVLLATTSETGGAQTRVVCFTDTGGTPSGIMAKVLANAATNTAYRGVALAP